MGSSKRRRSFHKVLAQCCQANSELDVDPLTLPSLPYPAFESLIDGPHALWDPCVSDSKVGLATAGDPRPSEFAIAPAG